MCKSDIPFETINISMAKSLNHDRYNVLCDARWNKLHDVSLKSLTR